MWSLLVFLAKSSLALALTLSQSSSRPDDDFRHHQGCRPSGASWNQFRRVECTAPVWLPSGANWKERNTTGTIPNESALGKRRWERGGKGRTVTLDKLPPSHLSPYRISDPRVITHFFPSGPLSLTAPWYLSTSGQSLGCLIGITGIRRDFKGKLSLQCLSDFFAKNNCWPHCL